MLQNLLPFMIVLAEDTDITGVFQNLAGNVLTLARGIVLPIAIIGIIWCGIKIMIASSSQEVSQAKQMLIYIIVGIVIVMFAPAILNQLKALSSSTTFNWGS